MPGFSAMMTLQTMFFVGLVTPLHSMQRGLREAQEKSGSKSGAKPKAQAVTLSLKHQHVLQLPRLHRHALSALAFPASAFEPVTGMTSTTVGLRQQAGTHAYYGNIAVGSQGQQMTMVFDTGSGNLVLPSTSCKSCKNGRFDPGMSNTGGYLDGTNRRAQDKDHSRHEDIRYSSGKLSGNAYEDTVCLGDDNSLCASNAHFLLADEESDDFHNFDFDGILGLAPRGPLSLGDGFSLLDVLVSEAVVPARMAAFHLTGGGEDDSEVTLGGYDKGRANAGLTWLSVIDGEDSWEVRLEDLVVGDSGLDACSQHGVCTAVLDSGCGAIGLPSGLGMEIAKKVGFQGAEGRGWEGTAEQCTPENLSKMPNIAFKFEGHAFSLSPQDYVEVSKKDLSHCRLYLRDMDGTGQRDPLVLGHPFLVKFYSVYDQDNLRVGLAPST